MSQANIIPYGRQSISGEDIQAVVDVLRSDFLTQGPVVPAFEEAVANYCHARHGVATSNATAALHIACLALDIGPGDWLWTSPTWSGTHRDANAWRNEACCFYAEC